MSIIAEAEKRQVWVCLVYDRDGGIIAGDDDDMYETEAAADAFGESCIDDPRYGSHEVEKVEIYE